MIAYDMYFANVRPTVQEWEAMPRALADALSLVGAWEREAQREREAAMAGAGGAR